MVDQVKEGQFIAAIQQELTDWDLLIPYAHAVHESGWFENVVGMNNFWGLKYPRTQWRRDMIDREPVRIPTTEYVTAKRAREHPKWFAGWMEYHRENIYKISYDSKLDRFKFGLYAKFCDWSRERKAARYYEAHIKSLWPEAHANRHNAERYFPALFNDNYRFATDNPGKYCESCMGIHRQLVEAAKKNGSGGNRA